jgi:hypothetical protein
MEVPQGNFLCSYLKQAKMSFFFFYKIGEQEGGTGPAGWGERSVGISGRAEEVGKECGSEYSANTVYTCM